MPTKEPSSSNWVIPSDHILTEVGEQKSPIKKVVDFFFDFLQSIALGGAFFVVFYLFIVQPHQIKGSSMFPTFKDKEYILTDKISYKFRAPIRGEIIILQSPKNPDIDYIKRIIGLPGERVKVEAGSVYLNGKMFDETAYLHIDTPVFPGGFIREGEEVTVPPDNLFVMGDNRPGSSDSREFGFVPYEHIIGRVIFRYFPLGNDSLVKTPAYHL